MGVFRKITRDIGTVGGELIGGSVKLVGKAVGTKFEGTGEWMEEVGDSVKTASKMALDNAGQFVEGTVKGIGSTLSYTAKGVGSAVAAFGAEVQPIDKQGEKSTLFNCGKEY